MAEPFTTYRLIILFMLEKVNFPLTNTQITNFILEKEYTNYFTVQQTFKDLLSSNLIIAEPTHNNTRYQITEDGRSTLQFFNDKISPAIKEDILSFLRENDFDLKQEVSVFADYFKSTETGYGVRCQIKDSKKSLIDLTLSVANKEQAEAVCRNWTQQSAEVYAALMDMLIK